GLNALQRGGRRVEQELDLVSEESGEGRGGSLVRDVRHIDPRSNFEKLACKMQGGADSAGTEIEGARPRIGEADELRDLGHLERRGYQENVRSFAQMHDRGEVVRGIVRELVVEGGIDRQYRMGQEKQGVPVGSRTRHV